MVCPWPSSPATPPTATKVSRSVTVTARDHWRARRPEQPGTCPPRPARGAPGAAARTRRHRRAPSSHCQTGGCVCATSYTSVLAPMSLGRDPGARVRGDGRVHDHRRRAALPERTPGRRGTRAPERRERAQPPEGHPMGERRMRWVITARQAWHVLTSSGLVAVRPAWRPAWSVGLIGARWWA